MSSEQASSETPSRPSASWVHVRALWASLSIVSVWLAVLFVGVFGENILSSTPGGTSTSVPVVVAVVPFALVATIVVARRGFRPIEEREERAADARMAREGSASETLRTKLA
jgi:hypothetical protein